MPHARKVPSEYQLVETRLQERLPDGKTRCNLCLWRCGLKHGQRGFCQAHVNRYGTLYNLSYGVISSIDIDAIEGKPVRHFRPGSRVMSVGSYGCNFRCGGCHNLEISWGVEALDALARGQSTAAYVTPEDLVAAAQRQAIQGIAFTYSEPAVWLEYVLDVSERAHATGLYTVYVSNSFVTNEALELMAPHVDVLCSDIKSMRDEFYREICRPATVQQVLGSIRKAHELGVHVETRTNIIPGKNDNPDEYAEIAIWEPLIDARRLLGDHGVSPTANPYVRRALRRLDQAEDWGEVRERLLDLHRTIHSEAIVLPLWQLTDFFAYHSRLRNVGSQPVWLYQNIDQWRLAAESTATED